MNTTNTTTHININDIIIGAKNPPMDDRDIVDAVKIHTLKNGARVISLSPHGFRFSDGTSCEGQNPELVALFNLKRQTKEVWQHKGMTARQMRMAISIDQLEYLERLCQLADVVILPFPVLTALREYDDNGHNIRDTFPNAVAMNATPDTMRSPPDEKVVDLDNWSY